MSWTSLPILPFLFALYLSVNGARSRKLSPSGAVTAFLVGFAVMSTHVRAIGVSLVVFYLVGSKATKRRSLHALLPRQWLDKHTEGKQRKAQLEAGYQGSGYRTGWQVLCNSLAAVVACVIWSVRFTPDVLPWSLFARGLYAPRGPDVYHSDGWCPVSPAVAGGLSQTLVLATLGQFACCLGDTLASELGILSSSPPILITTLKPVPAGTNGGISLGGTIASAIGGCIVGLAQFVSLVVENSVCRAEWTSLLLTLVGWGTAAGILGSMLDSFLGATLQRTRYSTDEKRILQDESVPGKNEAIKVISGINVLTNNQVNLLSSVVTALVVAGVA
ncbi:integral membrane protein DUF92-domain-containing protein [Boletus reticuloceps]|uniref:Integral membrane protein DUF92-domain-containing protein n=1 Tax=Boletus reticuloceps TaxID=495285 RepID=A0A8I3A6R4_9AGAM|nr:integral membrane protein DUF92-domain-containing protein [Boletus reticuloceps]